MGLLDRVPKDVKKNVEWRLRILRAAAVDRGLQEDVKQACFEDVLFWFQFAGWLFEPRALHKVIPFVTWTHQDAVILAMDGAISESEREEKSIDVILPKSRAQGATYIYLMIFLRRWLRDVKFTAGLVTRNEQLVDSKTDSDTLLWKFGWCLDMLPGWLQPEGGYYRNIVDHTFMNPVNQATITGYAATDDLGRGGRRTVFAMDEFGSVDFIKGGSDYAALDATQYVTNCRFLVSTYGADRGAFYEVARNLDYTALRLCLDWKDNPVQSRLAYRQTDYGAVLPVRQEETNAVLEYVQAHKDLLRRLARRGHVMVGKTRSKWYDMQCSRPGATPRSVAKELDMDPRGAVGKVFDMDVLDRMTKECCRPAVWQGKPSVDEERGEVLSLIRQDGGPLKLWCQPTIEGNVPPGKYVLGCDISAGGVGLFSSNSVIVGINVLTGEQTFEYTVKGMTAIKFARVAVAVARIFGNGYLGWEATGPTGTAFEREVMEMMGYYNVYYRERTQGITVRLEKKPGWWNGSDDDKGMLFEQLCAAMDEGQFIPRSDEMIKECGEYEWNDTGKIVHAPTRIRGASANKAHGDRCVAGGVANLLYMEKMQGRVDKVEEQRQDVKYGTLAWRMEKFGQKKYDDDGWGHEMTLAEVVGDRA